MSMPERIWRIVRGRWLVAEERLREAMADQQAAQELEETVQSPDWSASRPSPTRYAPGPGPALRAPARPSAARALPPSSRPAIDPLATDLALLGAPPACDMETLDRLYAERLAELRPQACPLESPDRSALVARRTALTEAYERLRDAINTTETRFEKLEF